MEEQAKIDWHQIFEMFHQRYSTVDAKERFIFTDRFFHQCLDILDMKKDGSTIWDLIDQWLKHRPAPLRCGYNPTPEQQALSTICYTFREKLAEYIRHVPIAKWHFLDTRQQLVIMLWQVMFLDSLSPLYITTPADKLYGCLDIANCDFDQTISDLIIASMYHPFPSNNCRLDPQKLWLSKIPAWCKMVLSLWQLNTPYFNLTEADGREFKRSAVELCNMLTMKPELVSIADFDNLVKKMLNGFWTTSYLGENIAKEISALGNFTCKHMDRFYPQFAKTTLTAAGKQKDKFRIGYISRRFYQHAVSYYMVNRVIYHDRNKFEVFLFSLGDYQDAMSELLTKNADHVQRFENLDDISSIAQSICDSKLDILVFADLGMDITTYLLAGLRLAPIQCVLPGDYKTSGAPNVDYYFTGEFEVPDAQKYYSEKIVRLPGMGTAHHHPLLDREVKPFNLRNFNEKGKIIPRDGVIFISCANGIKHQEKRDPVLIEILRKAPNAYLLLKPFADANNVYPVFMNRILEAAQQAEVENRLFILPPFKEPIDVLGLVASADVQLDTYPYGGWNTNLDALNLGIPIVTQEGHMSPSRWGANMLRILNVHEGIATDEAEYVEWAVRFAQDKELRQRVSLQIKNRVHVLFDGAAAQPAYEESLISLIKKGGEKKLE